MSGHLLSHHPGYQSWAPLKLGGVGGFGGGIGVSSRLSELGPIEAVTVDDGLEVITDIIPAIRAGPH